MNESDLNYLIHNGYDDGLFSPIFMDDCIGISIEKKKMWYRIKVLFYRIPEQLLLMKVKYHIMLNIKDENGNYLVSTGTETQSPHTEVNPKIMCNFGKQCTPKILRKRLKDH